MTKQVRPAPGEPKRPVVVRQNPDTGKEEYCFGLSLWAKTIPAAWKAFQDATCVLCGSDCRHEPVTCCVCHRSMCEIHAECGANCEICQRPLCEAHGSTCNRSDCHA